MIFPVDAQGCQIRLVFQIRLLFQISLYRIQLKAFLLLALPSHKGRSERQTEKSCCRRRTDWSLPLMVLKEPKGIFPPFERVINWKFAEIDRQI